MPAYSAPFPHQPDPALAELTRLGLAVARVAARLAEVEEAALDALAAQAAAAIRAATTAQPTLEDAIKAGHDLDLSDAAREAAAARIASITLSFEKAARAVRRTVALQARLASPHPFRAPPAPGAPAPARRANDPGSHNPGSHNPGLHDPGPRDPTERPDRHETGDEIGHLTDEQVVIHIRRDLDGAADTLGHKRPPAAAWPASATTDALAPPGAVHPNPAPVPDF